MAQQMERCAHSFSAVVASLPQISSAGNRTKISAHLSNCVRRIASGMNYESSSGFVYARPDNHAAGTPANYLSLLGLTIMQLTQM